MGLLNKEVMWEAIVSCNEEYDGVFYYAVKSTGICCKPSCKSKTPLHENVSFYPSVSLAIQDGYRPCKRCRPNLLQTNEEEIVLSVKEVIEREYRNFLTLDRLALEVGVSKYHLQRVFKHNTGISPLSYITKLRMDEAMRRLKTKDETITEIAHILGYKSSAHFSNTFKQIIGCTPTEYRAGGKL
jgi:AraC family transcriptional regulator of adaptative response / methylphosphotriester-DNA alkyltransferase methyltransferase